MNRPIYRLVKLGPLEIYRIETWTKRWFSEKHYWKVMKFSRFRFTFTDFTDRGSAVVALEQLETQVVEARERRLQSWQTVRTKS